MGNRLRSNTRISFGYFARDLNWLFQARKKEFSTTPSTFRSFTSRESRNFRWLLDLRRATFAQAFVSIIPFCRAKLNNPPASTTGRTSPNGFRLKTFPVFCTVSVEASRSTVTTSPVCSASHSRSWHSHGYNSPVATQLRKKIRAKLSATTTWALAAPNAIGACSRELPQPKFRPPTTIGYSVSISPSFTNRVG